MATTNLPVTVGGNGTAVPIPVAGVSRIGGRTAIVQFKSSAGAGTIQIQGSILPSGAAGQLWTDLLPAAFTGDNAANITIFPYYRVVGTSTLNGTVTVMV